MTAFAERTVTPLRGWSDAQLAALAEAFRRAVTDWAGAWGLDLPDEFLACAATPQDLDFTDGQVLGSLADSAAWLLDRAALLRRLHFQLFSAGYREGSLAAEVTSTCAEEFFGHLRNGLRLAAASLPVSTPSALTLAWTGWVMVRLPFSACVLLPPEGVEAMLERAGFLGRPRVRNTQQALETVDQALASSTLCVRAELEGCELGIGALQDLQLGDVLRLKHRLDKPVTVRDPAGSALFSGFLVRRGSQKSLQLAPRQTVQEELR